MGTKKKLNVLGFIVGAMTLWLSGAFMQAAAEEEFACPKVDTAYSGDGSLCINEECRGVIVVEYSYSSGSCSNPECYDCVETGSMTSGLVKSIEAALDKGLICSNDSECSAVVEDEYGDVIEYECSS